MLKLEIDGKSVEVDNGATVMDAANKLGLYIPHFCYHKKLSIAANCRMCLVQVEKAPKPLPACATPATDGMKVFTHSDQAVTAQKGVMEFLLINHPLDCPICDQGGECQLQDLAVGYGGSASRYTEDKRVVVNKNLGPLISTDMTRCIHCTRCVRFGQEVAGIMELGMIGRGEHAEIITFVGKTVDSEVSGNVIDLCPVGALTSKPFRYSARTWELSRRKSVSPHDGLGANVVVQIKHDKVYRVLPLENEDVNECWLADKDRFSYEGLNSDSRLRQPMLKQGDAWRQADWQAAIEKVAGELKRIVATHGAQAVGILASPHATLEELFLAQKLVRGLGSGNIDFRLRQRDFRTDEKRLGVPWLGTRVAEIASLKSALVVGSVLRKDHPLLALRLRRAIGKGLALNLINPVDDELLMKVAHKSIVAPSALPRALGEVVKAAAEIKGVAVPQSVAALAVSDASRKIAESLCGAPKAAVWLGNLAQWHAQASDLHALAAELARISGAKFGFLGEAANSVGGCIAGALPMQGGAKDGFNAHEMIEHPRKAYVLLGCEPELDCHDGAQALAAMQQAEFVAALSPWTHRASDYAHALLPIAPFSETAGTFVNTEARVQSFNGAVKPLGETRPGWKVLRVLGNALGLPGFDYESIDQVRGDIATDLQAHAGSQVYNALGDFVPNVTPPSSTGIERIADVPIYFADPLVRRAASLQKTNDAKAPRASLSASVAERIGASTGDWVRVANGANAAELECVVDPKLPANTARVAAAHASTLALGAMSASLAVERVRAKAVA